MLLRRPIVLLTLCAALAATRSAPAQFQDFAGWTGFDLAARGTGGGDAAGVATAAPANGGSGRPAVTIPLTRG